MNHDVIILCGGMGSRLKQVVNDRQKCVADVHGLPFLEYLINYLATYHLKRFILCTGHQADTVQAALSNLAKKFEIIISHEHSPLGTGGAIKQAVTNHVKTGLFLALNGDSICQFDLDNFFAFHQKKQAVCSIALTTPLAENDYGNIHLDTEQRIVSFSEKSATFSPYINAGLYLLEKDSFHINDTCFSLEKQFFPQLIKTNNVFGYITNAKLYDIGTPNRLKKALDALAQ